MHAVPNKPALEGRLAELYAKRERLAEEVREVNRDIAAVERTLSILPEASADQDNRVAPTDIAHCKTQRAALYEIARLNDGIVRATAAGDLIIAAGLTDAKRASVIATAHRFLRHNADWEWTDPGTFRLKAFVPQ